MKKPPLFLAFSGAFAIAFAILSPGPSRAQAPAAGDPALAQLLTEVAAQQATIADNQAKIDQKLVLIAEDIRVARIFVGRGGGKAK
jgi:hypothetical protein